jgi:hypothetical protein
MQVLAVILNDASLSAIDKVARDCKMYRVHYQADKSKTVIGTDDYVSFNLPTNLNHHWLTGEPYQTYDVDVVLNLLDVCNCDFFQGYNGDVLAVSYFPQADKKSVKEAIVNEHNAIMWEQHPTINLESLENIAETIANEFKDLEHELGNDDNEVFAYIALSFDN